MEAYPPMRPLTFYVGQFLNTCGVIFFLMGITSSSWMTMSPGTDAVPEKRKNEFVSRYGPFIACNYGGECDHPWLILAGVDRATVEVVQALLSLATILYLIGMVVMALQATLPKIILRHWRGLEHQIIVELLHPSAAVTGFIAMLVMGEVKRTVIAQDHQSESIGYGFATTLVAISLTVFGSVCMILNRYAVGQSRMAHYVVKIRRLGRTIKRKRRKFSRQRRSVSCARLSDVNVSVTDGPDNDSTVPPAAHKNISDRESDFSLQQARITHTNESQSVSLNAQTFYGQTVREERKTTSQYLSPETQQNSSSVKRLICASDRAEIKDSQKFETASDVPGHDATETCTAVQFLQSGEDTLVESDMPAQLDRGDFNNKWVVAVAENKGRSTSKPLRTDPSPALSSQQTPYSTIVGCHSATHPEVSLSEMGSTMHVPEPPLSHGRRTLKALNLAMEDNGVTTDQGASA